MMTKFHTLATCKIILFLLVLHCNQLHNAAKGLAHSSIRNHHHDRTNVLPSKVQKPSISGRLPPPSTTSRGPRPPSTTTSLGASFVAPSESSWDGDASDGSTAGSDVSVSIAAQYQQQGQQQPGRQQEQPQELQIATLPQTTVTQAEVETKAPEAKNLVASSTFNLIKAVIGCGMLALPSGLAAVTDSPMALIPSISVICLLGGLSAYTFALYGRLVHLTQAKSLGEIWERQKSKSSSWIISVAAMVFCFGSTLSFTILLGDITESFAQVAGASGGILASRALWVPVLAATVLLPLCNLQSLAALAPMSLVGVFAIVFTAVFIGFRCPAINPSSPYSMMAGGKFLASLASSQLPQFNTFNKGALHPANLIIGGMAATSFLGHFSAPDFYHTLKGDDSASNAMTAVEGEQPDEAAVAAKAAANLKAGTKAMADYIKVTANAFSAIAVINASIMALGFLTFGGNSMGIMLNNYSSMDTLATFCRMIMAVNVIGGFPFVFRGCRSEAMVLLNKRQAAKGRPGKVDERKVTKIILGLLVSCSLVLKNAGFVIGFNGAVMGSAIVFIFPALLFLSHLGDVAKKGQLMRSQRLEKWLCRFLVGFGALAVIAGGSVSVLNTFFPHMLM